MHLASTQSSIQHLVNLDEQFLGADPGEFLGNLAGPAWFEIPGKDISRRRAIVTLLHGNEPSGLKAVHHLLREQSVPATNLGVLVASVDAALHSPLLSHRYIPGERDLNRCFGLDEDSNQATLARNIVNLLNDYAPEAIVDTHNTSSHSEPFCISVHDDEDTRRLASLFSDHLIVIRQQLGILLEHVRQEIPCVTVEFGAFMDPDADWLAHETLHRFVMMQTLSHAEALPLTLLDSPIRLETEHHLTVTYSSSVDESADLTMINSIDQFNFRTLPPGQTLGWFSGSAHRGLVARDPKGENQFAHYFDQTGGLLQTRQPMTIFMATTDPLVANTDCLLYFHPA